MPIVIAAAVERLVKARRAREMMTPLSEEAPDLTAEQAYAIQQGLEQALVAGGERVIGWKAGFTNPVHQESYGSCVRKPATQSAPPSRDWAPSPAALSSRTI